MRAVLTLLAAALVVSLTGCPRPLTEPVRVTEANVVALRQAFGGDQTAAGPAKAAPVPTGWATFKGTVKLNGTPPPPTTLTVTSDHAVCAPGGRPVYANEVVVGADGGIKNVVVYLTTKYPDGDPQWEHPDVVAAAEAPPPFDQKECIFLTRVFTMRSTATLTILNSDPVGHNTNITGGGGAAPFNNTIPSGGRATYSPGGESSEPFGVSCSIHPWMAAYGIVRKSPYFAVTDENGQFELQNVPAGVPLEFRIWQEKSRFLGEAEITGTFDKFNKGRLNLQLDPDETRELVFTAPAKLFGGN
jgi:hypothetical protein